LTENELVDALLSGNESVFKAVFNQHYSLMYSLAQSIAGSSIADEVIQEAWVSAIKALPRFERRASFKSWLLRIVVNEAKSRLRKESRQVSLEAMQDDWTADIRFDQKSHWIHPVSQWDGDTPEELLSARQLENCLDKHLQQLPENQKVALKMRDGSGLSMEELCNILEVNHSNIRVLLHRARDKMLQVIDHFQQTGEC